MFNFNQFMIDCCKLIDKSKLLKLPTLHIAETSHIVQLYLKPENYHIWN